MLDPTVRLAFTVPGHDRQLSGVAGLVAVAIVDVAGVADDETVVEDHGGEEAEHAVVHLLSAVSKSGDVGGFEPRLSLAVERIIVNPTSVRGKTDMARVHIIWRQ